MDEPKEKKVFSFMFHKILPSGMNLNVGLDIPGETAQEAAEGLRSALASIIADINDKYPPEKKGTAKVS